MGSRSYMCFTPSGELAEDEEVGVCRVPRKGTASSFPVEDNGRCDLTRPISIGLVKSLSASLPAEELEADDTYKCFCEQQIQYSFSSNPTFIFPPYTSEAQKLCEAYLWSRALESVLRVVAILGVVVLNFLLKLVMEGLVKAEKHASVSSMASSQMLKLFITQFTNTALIVLIVNAQLHTFLESLPVISVATSALASIEIKLGDGDYDDFDKDWFAGVGTGLVVTIAIQIFSNVLPPLFTGLASKCCAMRSAKDKATQNAMNEAVELPEFNLPLRLAQTMNVVFCCLMYSSGMPILHLVGAIYCFVAYWADKITLLRYSKMPPQYDQRNVAFCCRLIPVGVLLHCVLGIWVLGHPLLFPSDFADSATSSMFESSFLADARKEYELYLYRGVEEGNLSEWGWYLQSRLLDCFRLAPLGNVLVLSFVLIYFALLLVYVIAGKRALDFFQFISSLCCRRPKGSSQKTKQLTEESFRESLPQMLKGKVITSYQLKSNWRYRRAYRAIVAVQEKRATEKPEKLAAEVSQAVVDLPKGGPAPEGGSEDQQE